MSVTSGKVQALTCVDLHTEDRAEGLQFGAVTVINITGSGTIHLQARGRCELIRAFSSEARTDVTFSCLTDSEKSCKSIHGDLLLY